MVVVKFGFRTYEIAKEDINKARSIWAFSGSQDDFEDELEKAGIEFQYAFFDEDF